MSFHPIAGVPLIRRIALSAQRGGFDAVVALAPDGGGGALRRLFAADPRTAVIPVVGSALDAAISTDRVALLPSDCLVNAATLERVRMAECNGSPVALRTPAGDAAIVLGPRADLTAIDGGDPSGLLNGTTPHLSLDGALCMPVPDVRAAEAAERELIRQLAALTADSDGPIARFDRAISTRLSRHLVRTPLRPNHITSIGTVIGFLGAWCLAQGSYGFGVLGTLLFWAAVIIDGCDGEVARLKFQESRFGYLYDITTDNIVHVAIFVGLGIGLYRAQPDGALPWLIGLLVGGFLCSTAATMLTLVRHPVVQATTPRSRRGKLRARLLHGFEALMNRDFAYVLVLLAVIGRLNWFLWGAAFGTYVYAAALVVIYRWRDAA